jgi:DNA-binding LacI/PurR family transcriptional regulator/DNA-binding transcriptional regulator YhcF (GntR family)
MTIRKEESTGLKYEQITQQLRERLEQEVYEAGEFLPAERSLAEEFGVSRPTLRKALVPLLEAGLLVNQPGVGTRVAPTNGMPGRAPFDHQSEPRSDWRILALLLPDITNRFFIEVTEAIEYAALQRGYQLLLCNSRHQASIEATHLKQLATRGVDGVIIGHDPNQEPPETLELLEKAGIPFVFLFSNPRVARYDSVVLDEQAGVQQALKYLFSLGHREIAYCRTTGIAPHPRETAYRTILAELGLQVRESNVLPFEKLEIAAGQEVVRRLLLAKPKPTAIFAGNDHSALLLLKHLAALQVRVPEDLSVIGFDNLSFTEHLTIPLTTVDQPKQEMGRRAVELLLERITFPLMGEPRREVLHPHLIIRESCLTNPSHKRS